MKKPTRGASKLTETLHDQNSIDILSIFKMILMGKSHILQISGHYLAQILAQLVDCVQCGGWAESPQPKLRHRVLGNIDFEY